jgi:hypothetical protein
METTDKREESGRRDLQVKHDFKEYDQGCGEEKKPASIIPKEQTAHHDSSRFKTITRSGFERGLYSQYRRATGFNCAIRPSLPDNK